MPTMEHTSNRQDLTAASNRGFDDKAMMATLWQAWTRQAAAQEGRVPDRASLTMQMLKSILSFLVICERRDDDHIHIRLAGSKAEEFLGGNLTGVNLLDLSPADQRQSINNVYSQMAAVPCGFYISETLLLKNRKNTELDALLLPLADKAGAPRLFIGVYQFGPNSYDTDGHISARIIHRQIRQRGYIDLGFGLPA